MSMTKGLIRKMTGNWSQSPEWEGMRSREYPSSTEYAAVTENWLIGKAEKAENFALRYYRVEAKGFTRKEHHPYDHGIVILHGQGEVQIGGEKQPFSEGDMIYIPPDVEHQLVNTGDGAMGFLCIIPAKRQKHGEVVWADEKIIFDDQTTSGGSDD